MGAATHPNEQKALEVLLYVSERVPNMYRALKTIYAADKVHLSCYGRLIYDETFVAMKHGPVPSEAYDQLKDVREGRESPRLAVLRAALELGPDNHIRPKRGANLRLLTKSEIECLDAAIAEHAAASFDAARDLSHDAAYRKSWGKAPNSRMDLGDIIRTLPNAAEVLDYMGSD